MALINCTECGNQVSDKALECPKCGCPIEEMGYEITPNKTYNEGAEINTGYDSALDDYYDDFREGNNFSKMKKYIFIGVLLLAIIGGAVACYNLYNEKCERERIEKELQEERRREEERRQAEERRLEEMRREERRQAEERRREEERRQKDPKYKGWNFVRNGLKSPSTASLVGYVGPDAKPCVEMANALGISGLSIAMFQVDAQNGFGAMIRSEFLVFYKNGTPLYMENAADLRGDMHILRTALQLNGF